MAIASNGNFIAMLSTSEASQSISAATSARNVTPSPGPPPDDAIVGAWLCDEGKYQKYIEALSGYNPGLRKADPNNKEGPLKKGNALVVLLDGTESGQPNFTKPPTEFKSSGDLRNHLENSPHDHNRRRIYLMEGLAPDYVAVIGGHFMMDPTFFQRQERTCVWSNDFTPVSDALPQPSLLDPSKSFHLQYCELRQFNKAIENRYYFCRRTRRHVGMTAPRHEEESTTGILRRKVSWWSRKTVSGGWDIVILCDPQLRHLSPNPKEAVHGQPVQEIKGVQDELKNGPFQDGYVDFLPTPPYTEDLQVVKHPHISMLRDLIHYYQNYSHLLAETDWKEPQNCSVFLKKIVAAHYLQLVDYIKVMLPSLELKLTTAWVEEQDQWKSLQTTSRRCGNYRDDIEDTLLSLGYPLDGRFDASACSSGSSQPRHIDWKDCEKDFHYAYLRLKILKERADNLMTSMTGLASIAGNRQNLEEAKRVKRLNLLALLFIPLAYTSSLFSMQDSYAPDSNKFWVYWVSAIGAVLFTSFVTLILDKSLDEEANWTLAPIKYLKFWGKTQNLQMGKRKTTGFYDQRPVRQATPFSSTQGRSRTQQDRQILR